MAQPSLNLVSEPETNGKQGLYVRTFGCQMNEYDSQKLIKILGENYSLVDSAEKAQLIVVNTCSVRDKPEQKLYSLLGEFSDLRTANPSLMIGVGGCVAQQEGERIVKRSKNVDFVFGTHNLSLVPALIDMRKNGAAPQVAIDYRDEWEGLPLGFPENIGVSAFVAISRGCNKNCTYCIVPTTRGPEVSRSFDEIEREVKIAVHRGVKEIVLLGQTVNSYGRDLKPKRSFVELLEALSKIEGLKRIRFTSPHPQEVRQDFIDLVAYNEKVCRHIHMPLQSGSDKILKAMNRNYRREKYLRIINALKERVPEIAITTDIIVGFPGETVEDFEDTLDLMDQVQFDNSFSFVFSPRPGTKATVLEDPVSYEEKLERLKILQAKQLEITQDRLKQWVGKPVSILLEGPSHSHPDRFKGRISQNTLVNLNREYPDLKAGMFVEAMVTETARFTLKAELLAN